MALVPLGGNGSGRRRTTGRTPSIGALRREEFLGGGMPSGRRTLTARAPSPPPLPPLSPLSSMGALPAPSFGAPSIPSTGGLSFGRLGQEVLRRINEPFRYDPQRDPRYAALTQLARARGEAASRRALEELNARGILNSTITADRVAQAQQAAEQEAVLQYLPQLYEQAWQQRQQQINSLLGLLGATQQQEQFGANLQADLFRFGRSYSLEMAQLAQRQREFEFDANMRRAAYELDRLATEQQLTGRTSPTATSRVIGQVVGMAGPDEAFRWLSANASRLASEGADLNAVLDAIVARWPERFRPADSLSIPFGAFAGENPQ